MSLTVGFWNTVMNIFAAKSATTTSATPARWLVDWVRGGENTLSGENVTPDSAMRLAAVWACVRNRSEDVGKLPCFLYRRRPDGGKERAVDHPLYSLIRDQPNLYQTAFEFRQLMQAWIDLRGNAYALKEYDERGRIVALWPVNPTWVTVLCVPGTWDLFYQLRIPQQEMTTVPAEAVVHVRGMSLDGFIGVSPITYHRETIGLGIAAQRYGAAFFGNSAQPNGGLKVPTVLSKEAGDALRAQWEGKYKGVDNAKKLAIFDGGMEWVQTGMDNTDAQYLETRIHQNREVYAMYRMPAHKAGDLTQSTNNNIEHQGLEYVTDCLMTELVRWEQTLKRDLLTAADREQGLFFEFMPDALLRGDLKSRYEAYAVGRMWSWLSANDICDRENMNHVPNGHIYLQPLNYVEAGTKPPPISAPSPSPGGAKYLLALAQTLVAQEREGKKYSDDQPRDENGRFASGGAGVGPDAADARMSVDVQDAIRDAIGQSGISHVQPGSNDIVDSYKSSGFYALNSGLRKGTELGEKEVVMRDALDALIDNANVLQNDIVLYRGVGMAALDGMDTMKSMSDAAFLSTSFNPRVATDFAGFGSGIGIVQIRIPTGSKALLLGDPETSPAYEAEVLLGRNSKFTLSGSEDITVDGQTIKVYRAKLASSGSKFLSRSASGGSADPRSRFAWLSIDDLNDVTQQQQSGIQQPRVSSRGSPDQPRDDHGRWTSGGLAATKAWVKTTSARDALNSVVHSHHIREALVFGINSLIAHGSQMHGSFLDSHVEETVGHIVHNFSDVASISLAQAKEYMSNAVHKLANLRAKQVVGAKALAPQDQILEFLHFVMKAIDNLDVSTSTTACEWSRQPHVNGHDKEPHDGQV